MLLKEVLMRKIIVLAISISIFVFFTGCSTTIVHAKFEDSNQVFIEETVAGLELGSKIGNIIPSGSSVALVSMETNCTLDAPMMAVIEDQLICSLVRSGYKVSERDKHLIEKLNNESRNSNYSFNTSNKIIRFPENSNVNIALELEKNDVQEQRLIETKLASSDYLVTYRVLECGLIYRPTKPENPKIGREGLLRLHVRVENANSGEVLIAENFESQKTDEIEKMFVDNLKEFHYTNFEYEYPFQTKPKGKKLFVDPIVKSSSQNAFYFAPTCGIGFSDRGEGFCFGGTIGYSDNSFGKIGVNYSGVPDIEVMNITLQYEKPVSTSVVTFSPKFGLGYLHSTTKKSYENYWYHYDSYKNHDSFGGVLGGALEFNIAKYFCFKAGYDWFIGIGDSDASNTAITGVLGFKF